MKGKDDFTNPGKPPVKLVEGDMKLEGDDKPKLGNDMVPVASHVRGKPGGSQGHPAKPKQPLSMKFLD